MDWVAADKVGSWGEKPKSMSWVVGVGGEGALGKLGNNITNILILLGLQNECWDEVVRENIVALAKVVYRPFSILWTESSMDRQQNGRPPELIARSSLNEATLRAKEYIS